MWQQALLAAATLALQLSAVWTMPGGERAWSQILRDQQLRAAVPNSTTLWGITQRVNDYDAPVQFATPGQISGGQLLLLGTSTNHSEQLRGSLSGLALGSGNLSWRLPLIGDSASLAVGGGAGSPIAVVGTSIAGHDPPVLTGRLVAVDPRAGTQQLWQANLTLDPRFGILIGASTVATADECGQQGSNPRLEVLDLATGEQLWGRPLTDFFTWSGSLPFCLTSLSLETSTAVDVLIVFASVTATKMHGNLSAVDARNGATLWSKLVFNNESIEFPETQTNTFHVAGHMLLMSSVEQSGQQMLSGLNISTGEQLWLHKRSGPPHFHGLPCAKTLANAAEAPLVYTQGAAIDSATGAVVWSPPNESWTPGATGPKVPHVIGLMGPHTATALSCETGMVAWEVDLSGDKGWNSVATANMGDDAAFVGFYHHEQCFRGGCDGETDIMAFAAPTKADAACRAELRARCAGAKASAGRNACQRCVGAHRDDFFTTIGCTQDTVREFCDYPKVTNPVETVPKGSVSWQQVSSGVKYMQLPQQIGRSLVYAQPTGVLLLVTEHASVDAVRVTSGEIQWSARLVPCGNMVAQNVMLSDDQARVYVGLARSPEPNEEVSNSHRTQRSCLIALDVASGASLWTWQSHHPDGEDIIATAGRATTSKGKDEAITLPRFAAGTGIVAIGSRLLLTVLDERNGFVLWQSKLPESMGSTEWMTSLLLVSPQTQQLVHGFIDGRDDLPECIEMPPRRFGGKALGNLTGMAAKTGHVLWVHNWSATAMQPAAVLDPSGTILSVVCELSPELNNSHSPRFKGDACVQDACECTGTQIRAVDLVSGGVSFMVGTDGSSSVVPRLADDTIEPVACGVGFADGGAFNLSTGQSTSATRFAESRTGENAALATLDGWAFGFCGGEAGSVDPQHCIYESARCKFGCNDTMYVTATRCDEGARTSWGVKLPSDGATQPSNGWSDLVAVKDVDGMLSVVAMGRGHLVKVDPPAHLDRCHEAFMAACEGTQAIGKDRCQQCVGGALGALGAAGCSNDMLDNFCPVI